jgi:hypothetical protein
MQPLIELSKSEEEEGQELSEEQDSRQTDAATDKVS